jgi:putative ABC transport system permease protein
MMLQDFRLAIRCLRATPVITAVAILSLALGIGANTAVFSLVDSLLLRALPVVDPDRLTLLSTGPGDEHQQYSNLTVDLVRRYATNFDGVCAWALPGKGTVGVGADARVVDRQFVSGDYFSMLGVRPAVGRLISAADDVRDGGPEGLVAVISYSFWQRQYAGAPQIIGSKVLFDRVPVTVIGVTPPAFFGVIVGRSFDIAIPVRAQPVIMSSTPYPDDGPWLRVMLRLKPGQSLQEATTAIRAAQPAIRAGSIPKAAGDGDTFLKQPFRLDFAGSGVSPLRDRFERPLLALLAVAGLVLLIACANIANLMLVRGAARHHELMVRVALGASRCRLARQLLAESALISAAGAAVALVFAAWIRQAIVGQLSTFMMPIALHISTDWRMLAFTAIMMIATTVLFGVVPALRAGAVVPASVIQSSGRQGGAGAGESRLSVALIIVQVAVSLTLTVTAGLLVRSFERLARAPLGFERDHAIVVTINSPSVPAADRRAFYQQLVTAVRGVPGVGNAGGSMNPPIVGMLIGNFVVSEPGVAPPPEAEPFSQSDRITPGLLAAYGMALRAGRDFDDRDSRTGEQAMIVNEAFVRRFIHAESAIGRAVSLTYRMPSQGDYALGSKTIVGVVSDSIFRSIRDGGHPTIYLPFSESDGPILQSDFYIAIRASGGSPVLLARQVSEAILAVKRELTLTVRPIGEQIDSALAQDRLVAVLGAFFGALAVLLAALGLYGITAYSVARRQTEIGVRMALGAAPADVVRLVLSRVASILGTGVVVGVVVSLWASSLVGSFLYGIEPRDPATLSWAAVILAIVGASAGWLPAWRASRTDPAAVLRNS